MSHMTTYFWGNFSVKIFIVCCTLKECFAQYWCPILLNLTSIVNCRQSSPPVQESQFHWFFNYLIFPVICSTCSQVWCFSNLNQTHHFVLQKGNDMLICKWLTKTDKRNLSLFSITHHLHWFLTKGTNLMVIKDYFTWWPSCSHLYCSSFFFDPQKL